MSSVILDQVAKQRESLKEFLQDSMSQLSRQCARNMDNVSGLEALLKYHMSQSTYCKNLWVLDHTAHQLTATISKKKLLEEQRGRDRIARPYMQRALTGEKFYLSDAYISRNRKQPTLTSVQTILDEDGRTMGYLGADFDLRKLPHTAKLNLE